MSLLNNQSSCSSCSLQVRIQQLENDNNEMQINLQQSNERIAEHVNFVEKYVKIYAPPPILTSYKIIIN
ncbi:unnamed protein product [Meloidogyne enterolobii]|uniref:Uncharacterized protein n=1 Tax=Meloidogyne enterolobii TaxID=390850 RepID=A0ACB0XV37_MELEN